MSGGILSKDDSYIEISIPFKNSLGSEDIDAKFFDSDNDGDLDLYVASGGKAFSVYNRLLDDRLYINDGKENFFQSKSVQRASKDAISNVRKMTRMTAP